MRAIYLIICCLILTSCGHRPKAPEYIQKPTDTVKDAAGRKTVILAPTDSTTAMNYINTGHATPQQLIDFAQTVIGVPYKYASSDPQQGMDCSGFITYVFNHFGIAVPRTSVDFTNVKQQVLLQNAHPGDLILFTGTEIDNCTVGHMGIVVKNDEDGLQFIHSTSGKSMGVVISKLNVGYGLRYVKTVRVFQERKEN